MHDRHSGHSSRHATGRFSGFRGGGRGGFHSHRHGGGGGGGGLLRAGRLLKSADLHLLLLALLEERPRHGYDLIKSIQELAAGAYVPSPGMVYPALNYLEELGHVAAQAEGAKKQYTLTESGLVELDANRQHVAQLLEVLKRVGRRLGRAQAEYERADEVIPRQDGSLDAVRRELKAALFDSLDEPAEEQQRVADILRHALAEIRKRKSI